MFVTRSSPSRLTAGLATLAAAAACAAAVIPTSASAAAAAVVTPTTAVACADATLMPTSTDLARIDAATLCLINQQRAAAGVAALVANSDLTSAAAAHSADMVALDYFDHVSPSGEAPIDRVTAAGYGGPEGPTDLGENIAAVVAPATPDAVVAMWMNSPDHRANILDPDYRDSGIGVAPEIPATVGAGPGATYTQDFGATG
jgi:uncharacterized protein YkwD